MLAEEGAYTRPEVIRFVEDAFRMRRDKIGQYWFDEVTPLEAFELETGAASWTLSFRDLGVERGYADASAREYTVEVRGGRRLSTLETTTSADVGRIQIEPKVDATAASPDRWGRTLVLAVDIHTARRDAQLARPVRVFIGRQDQDPNSVFSGGSTRHEIDRTSSHPAHGCASPRTGSGSAAWITPWTELLFERSLGHLGQRSQGVTPAHVGCGARKVRVIACEPHRRTDSDSGSCGYIAHDQRDGPFV